MISKMQHDPQKQDTTKITSKKNLKTRKCKMKHDKEE